MAAEHMTPVERQKYFEDAQRMNTELLMENRRLSEVIKELHERIAGLEGRAAQESDAKR